MSTWVEPGVPALLLAPMEGVTDAPMRALLGELGGFDFCVAEFLRVSQVVPPAATVLRHVPELQHGARTPTGLPVAVQLLGGDGPRLAQTAQLAVQAGAAAIDLNFGCPARTVNRHDGGATLLKYPQRLEALVRAVRQALPPHIPVSVKLRLGWEDPRDVFENAARAAAAGAAWLTLHARTRSQGYRPPAHWQYIAAVRQQLKLPIVANGDIWTFDDWRRCRDLTGCEHFMLGRGAVADPWLAGRIAVELCGRSPNAAARRCGWPQLWQRFLELSVERGAAPLRLAGRLKQWAKMAQNNLPPDSYERLKRLADPQAIVDVIDKATAAPHDLRATPPR